MKPSTQVEHCREQYDQSKRKWHRKSLLPILKNHIAGSIARGGLPCGMQGLEKCYERGSFRRAQILAVRGHVAASLDHLADELVLREPNRNTVQRRTSLSS